MAVLVRRFDGTDLVIPAADLSRIGLKPGQFVALRPMQPLPLLEPRPAAAESPARQHALETLWQSSGISEEIDAECSQEEMWEQWGKSHAF